MVVKSEPPEGRFRLSGGSNFVVSACPLGQRGFTASGYECGRAMPFSQGHFQYQPIVLTALERTISADRLSTYIAYAGFDKERAIRLYVWNSYVSQCFHLPLQSVEVSTRNTVNEYLSFRFGTGWPQDARFLNLVPERRDRTQDAIRKVTKRVTTEGHPVTTGRVVAGLPFDFWVGLFTTKYDRPLWQTSLHNILPNLPKTAKRRDLYELLRSIKELRNRVAHYEPIFQRDLSKEHTNIIAAIRHRCTYTADWVSAHSRLQLALRSKP